MNRRLSRGEVDWAVPAVLAGILVVVGFSVSSGIRYSKGQDERASTWEVQELPVEDDGVKCYILTTPKGAVDLECLPYHYEVEENEDVQQEMQA